MVWFLNTQFLCVWHIYTGSGSTGDVLIHLYIFTMVTNFLRWTLLKFFSSFPDEQSTKSSAVGPNHRAAINTSNEVKSLLLWEFWIYNFSLKILERVLRLKHCKYKEWVSFFLGSWGMNRSAEQTNRPRTASRFTRFVCSVLRFIPHEPRKKDTHSLNVNGAQVGYMTKYRRLISHRVAEYSMRGG